MSKRTVVYVVWGDEIRPLLERSVASVKKWHPECDILVMEGDPSDGLMNKPNLLKKLIHPPSTVVSDTIYLFLDADTVLLGDVDFGFRKCSQYSICCCINECPWLRRYNEPPIDYKDMQEYNTGVMFIQGTPEVKELMSSWERLAKNGPKSKWLCGDQLQHMDSDDQWAFSQAVEHCRYNPYILSLNYNFRPGFHTRFFTPLKIWHSVHPVPEGLESYCAKHDGVKAPLQWCVLGSGPAVTK